MEGKWRGHWCGFGGLENSEEWKSGGGEGDEVQCSMVWLLWALNTSATKTWRWMIENLGNTSPTRKATRGILLSSFSFLDKFFFTSKSVTFLRLELVFFLCFGTGFFFFAFEEEVSEKTGSCSLQWLIWLGFYFHFWNLFLDKLWKESETQEAKIWVVESLPNISVVWNEFQEVLSIS